MSLIKQIPKNAYFLLLTLLIFGNFLFFIYPANSGVTDYLSGYAWSENIGWLSLNCNDGGTCVSLDYGVGVDTLGNLSGYAWSENIGWVSFNASDVAGCPSGTCAPHLDTTTGKVTGWAKVLSSATASDSTWDGFISLSGTGYGVSVLGCNWNGWAWGSSVVGWISFSGSGYGVMGNGNACVVTVGSCTGVLPTNATACVAGDPVTDTPFTSVPTCSFSGTTKCHYMCDNGYVADGGTCRATACNNGVDDDADGMTDLTDLGCTDINDDSEVNIVVDPKLTISRRVVNIGDTVTLNWNTGGISETMCILTANNIPVTPDVFTADDGPADLPFEGTTTQVVNARTTFEINCGGKIDSRLVEVIPRMFET